MLILLSLIILIGIVGAISFLRSNNVESEDGQNASDFDIKEIK